VALHGDVGRREFGWGYTTVLDVVALAVFAGLCWLHRNRRRFGTQGHEAPYANDPVCGMQVEKSHAPARATLGSGTYYFCCDHCRSAFLANPEKYSGTLQAEG
jgi:YHS domain-containing protein